ncbi:hypothetical protein [Sphingopyxis sp.]|uniref:hypothetical protein n=1 Tax=Sphingopyxis sp. TaxID=1908224 RepID=UPI0025EA905D|nr:hypothetical protein [Sphingopyxis sp.]
MRDTANLAPTWKGKRRLLESCAIVAGLAALAYGGPALAQVAGTGQAVTGPGLSSPTISAPGPGPTVVNTTGDQTIINWTPSNAPVGGVIDFLPTGNSLNFTGNGQYIVLNRFVSGAGLPIADQIAINGTVNSIDFATSGGRGGNIWFYNTGGILIGATGVMNVGSLVLTANDVLTTGGLLGPSGEIRFRGAPGSTSNVTVSAGAAINANNAFSPGSSYVALVAPRVVQAGAVRVDGSVGYVAAEQADIRINSGLFDINVQVGAEGGNVITHTGTTGGPGHLDSNPNDSRVYMVAIPKNLAVTMLVSGQIGYDAVSAQVDPNGAVRLSAGYNITNGELNDTPVNATAANMTVGDTLFSSSVVTHASGTLAGRPDNMIPPSTPPTPQTGKIIVRGDADFSGDAGATLTAGADQAIEVDGALTLQSLGQLQTDGSRQGGNATLSVLGGSVTAGFITVASIGAGDIGTSGDGGDGAGGDAVVLISGTGSTLTTNGLNIQSTGIGGGVTLDSGGLATAVDNSGNGNGGDATLTVENGGALSVNGSISVASTGIGQTGNILSGNGTGGIARIAITGAATAVDALITSVSADGIGGAQLSQSSVDVTTQSGGSGTGGSAVIAIDGNDTTAIDLGGLAMSANGIGGDSSEFEGSTGGDGTGGTVGLAVDGGVAVDMSDLLLSAEARSGAARSPSNISATSGDSLGGTVSIAVANGSGIINDGNTSINVSGLSGFGDSVGNGTGGDVVISATTGGLFSTDGSVSVNAAGGNFVSSGTFNAGAAVGGNVDLTADGGTITAGSFFVSTNAQRPNADNGGGAVSGGTIDLLTTNNGSLSATDSGGFNEFSASASSGAAPNDALTTGGTIQVIADGGTIAMANYASFSASGVSGGNLTAGASPLESGIGGTVLIRVRNSTTGTGSMTFDDIFLDATGATNSFSEGINAGDGAAGAVGGTATFDMQSGTFTADELSVSADGFGGSVAGTGRGGTATFTQTGGTITAGTLSVSASGEGGFDPAVSGMGIGGTATINLFGGTLTGGDVSVSADGVGGFGANGNDDDPANPTPTGAGGIGQGGDATINIDGTAVIQTATLAAYANGEGGEGGAYFAFNGVAGDGGDAGDGIGGTATINITSGTLTTADLIADAGSIGGDGGNVFASSSSGSVTGIGVGGTGGTGQGGTATIDFATSFTATGTVISDSTGNGGVGGFGTVGGDGGGGIGGLAQIIVTNFDAGALAVTVDASADGGDGGVGDDGAGGNGGTANGGTSRIEADGANANILVTQANFVTAATGGGGGSANSSFLSEELVGAAGGNGGDATGGTLAIAASNGATVAIGPDTSGIISLSSAGTGGSGGSGAFNGFGGMRIGGDGGTGGGGTGGTVRLSANGGTLTSNGSAVDITVSGASGAGGSGGTGTAGDGTAGGVLGTAGGRAIIDASGTSPGVGAIALGSTTIAANGDAAGRIEIRNTGDVSFTSLTAEALGSAPPTNNDTDEAPAGIFFAATGGAITTSSNMTLTTDSSFGTYAQSNGTVTVGGDLTINAADQIDIRHDFREGTAPTIAAGGNFTATAAGISSAPGSLLSTGGTLSLTSTLGGIGVDQLDGNDIFITAAGAVSVEHAEAVNDFTASGASFRTGLNSIVTGGDILVTSPGAVDLGNSTAGGFVEANGQSILFNTIGAGGSVSLTATGNTAGAEGITGGSIDAGGSINLNATRIDIAGTLTTVGSLFAVGSAGPVAIALAEAEDDISIFAGGDLSGTYNAEGNINLTSTANINASANATGFESSSSGPPIASTVLINAVGDVNLNDNSATGMFGVNAGGAVTMAGGDIGEDLFVLAGTIATISDVTAGDDVMITAPDGILASGVVTTGSGPDDRSLIFAPFSPSSPAMFQIVGSPPDQSNIVLTAAAGDITASNLNAAANLTAAASGQISATGPLQAGGDIALTATSADLATLVTPVGDRIATLNASGDITIAVTDSVTGGVVRAGGDIGITAGSTANLVEVSTAAGNVLVATTDGMLINTLRSGSTTGLSSTDGGIVINALDADEAISATARTIQIIGQNSLNFTNLTATGGDASVRTSGNLAVATATVAGLADLRAGNDLSVDQLSAGNVNLEADQDMTLNNVTTVGSLYAGALGTATINGAITGPNLIVASGDINIASTGRIGQLGTSTSVLVTNISTEDPTFIGGTGTRNGWHLDADEITRIYGNDITVRGERLEFSQGTSVGSSRSPDVFVDDFTINAAQQLGGNGTFLITTPGKMRVNGDVRFTGMTDSQGVNLFGRDSVEIIMGSGSIHLSGSSPDQLAGNLTIEADDIVVASTQAISDISTMTSTAAIDARLAQNDGITSDIGALAANRITLNHNLDDSVYIQNSGTGTAFEERRGITFGTGGLLINGPGNQDSLVINAVHRNASGGLVTGLDVIPLININAPSGSSTVTQTGFNAQSTINGCLIGNVAGCTTSVSFDFESSFPVQDVIEEEIAADGEDSDGQSLPVSPLITMRELDPLSGEPLLDDPVTGAGNDDLWTPTEQP